MHHESDVLYVRQKGDASAVEFPDGAIVHAASSVAAARERLEGLDVDCAVCESELGAEDGLDAVAAVSEQAPEVPVLLVADEADGAEAAAATRRGVAEYVPRDALGGDETVADRVAAVADRASSVVGRGADPSDRERVLSDLLSVSNSFIEAESREAVADRVATATADVLGFETNAVFLRDAAAERLEPAAVTEATRDLVGDLSGYDAGEGHVGEAFATGEARTIDDAGDGPIRSLLLLPLGRHGVLSIGARSTAAFDEADRRTAKLLTTGATAALDRTSRVERIERLHRRTRAMMRAESREETCAILRDAARDVLGHRLVGVHLFDPDSERLAPVVWTDEVEAAAGAPPAFDRGQGLVWAAYRSGEPKVYHDLRGRETHNPESPFVSELHLPLGEHGVLLFSEPEPNAFDTTDLQLARLLAANAAAALERIDRQRELERFETVFENAGDMLFIVDGDGRLTNVTQPLADRLGRDRADLVGQHASEICGEKGVAAAEDLVRTMVAADDPEGATYESTMPTATGDEFPVEIELSLLPADDGFEGAVGTVRDRSELERARTRLEEERNRFEFLFDNIPDAVVEVRFRDGEPIVQSVNPAFADVFGYDPAAIIGESLNDHILLPEQRGDARALDDEAREKGVVRREIRRLTADGPRQFLFRGLPYRDEDENLYGFGIYTDITDRQMRHRQLQVLNRVLRHNLRNDLNLVVGYAEQIADAATKETVADYVDALTTTVEELVALSNKAREAEDVLEAETDSSWVDASAVAADAVARYRRRYGDAVIDFDGPIETRVAGDERLTVAVENLLENAIEHHPASGDDGAPRVRVSIDDAVDGRVALRIADDGAGIPEHEREVVTGEAEITPLQHASGLGLWLVAWIVDAYGGDVEFGESDLGGAVVSLYLPRI
ncbi:PAS domain S-box protein [Halostella sp. JP-L12]|uniref:PAS domain S-box protein n=1 Tax=Halostella TaxID=1843185 RepID=UPI000EF7CE6C|nr:MULTISPECIES: GAF domain-containing protein [Halostella]NHN46328.1 PAS domain S-box protein [Halostella sp. JP-L12]